MQGVLKNKYFLMIIYLLMFFAFYKAFSVYPLYTSDTLIAGLFIYFLYHFVRGGYKKNLVASIILSLVCFLFLPYQDLYLRFYVYSPKSLKLTLLIIAAASIAVVLLIFILIWGLLFVIKEKNSIISPISTKISSITLLKYSFFPVLGFGLTLKHNFPAKLTPDSFEQLAQINGTAPFSDIHSIGHTLFCSLLMKFLDSPSIVIIFQILAMSLILGWSFAFFEAKGFSSRVLMPVSILFGVFSTNRDIITYFWKDIPYSIAILLSTFLLIVYVDRKHHTQTLYLVMGGISAAGVYLFRHNGLVVFVILSLAFLFFIFKYSKMKFVTPLIISVVLILGTHVLAFDVLHTRPNNHGAKYGIFAKAVVSVASNHGNMSPQQLNKLYSIVPKDIIDNYYVWGQGGKLMWIFGTPKHPKYFYNTAIEKNHKEILNLFIDLYPKNIGIMTWDLLGSASLIWQFKIYYIDKNMTFMCFLFVCIFVIARKNKIYALPFLPVLANALSIAISNTTYEPRYIYPTIAAFPVLIIYSYMVLNNPCSST